MEPAESTRFTETEYLALEHASATRHEFVDGRIVALANGSLRHNLIATIRADVRRVAHWRRTEIGRWILTESEGAASLVLDGLGVTIPLDEVYARLELADEG